MWVRFVEDFDFRPRARPRSLRAYKAETVRNVTRECFERAAHRVVECDPPEGRQVYKGGFRCRPVG